MATVVLSALSVRVSQDGVAVGGDSNRRIVSLQREVSRLRSEVKQLRQAAGLPPLPGETTP